MLYFKSPGHANLLDSVLKTLQQLQQEGSLLNWWHYNQIMSRYSINKRLFGFLDKLNAFGIILNAGEKKNA